MDFEKADKEAIEWQSFLEQIVGVLAFTFALSSLSLPNPLLSLAASILSFVILTKLINLNSHKFPPELTALRNKQDKTIAEEAMLAYANHKYLSNKKYSIYLLGTLSLAAVLFTSLIRATIYVAGTI